MSDARRAISAAEQANASRLAPEPLGDARRFSRRPSGRFSSSPGPARMNAVQAKNRAAQALASSQPAADNGRR